MCPHSQASTAIINYTVMRLQPHFLEIPFCDCSTSRPEVLLFSTSVSQIAAQAEMCLSGLQTCCDFLPAKLREGDAGMQFLVFIEGNVPRNIRWIDRFAHSDVV